MIRLTIIDDLIAFIETSIIVNLYVNRFKSKRKRIVREGELTAEWV